MRGYGYIAKVILNSQWSVGEINFCESLEELLSFQIFKRRRQCTDRRTIFLKLQLKSERVNYHQIRDSVVLPFDVVRKFIKKDRDRNSFFTLIRIKNKVENIGLTARSNPKVFVTTENSCIRFCSLLRRTITTDEAMNSSIDLIGNFIKATLLSIRESISWQKKELVCQLKAISFRLKFTS